MKRAVTLARPELRFPEPGWRERFLAFVAVAEEAGLELSCALERGASAAALGELDAKLGRLPGDLRALLASADGGRIGHVILQPTKRMRLAAPDLFAFAVDHSGSAYAASGAGSHAIVYLCEDRASWEHRFTSMNAFLESTLVRAHAAALHRQAEVDAGDDLDDRPWLDAARALEMEIDPKMLRTRED